jgi:hypothetical protein
MCPDAGCRPLGRHDRLKGRRHTQFGYGAEGLQARYKSHEEGWHPIKPFKLLAAGKCTADPHHPDPLSRDDEGGTSR